MEASLILRDVALRWHADPVVLLGAAVAVGVYLAGARRARGGWQRRRTMAFLAGVAAIVVALESGLHEVGEDLLSVHMAQHLLLLLCGPPLVLLGAPLELALRALPRESSRWLAGLARSRGARALGHPVLCFAAFTAVLLASHAPPLYDAALRHQSLHAVLHAAYLWAAFLFWLPALGVAPGQGPSPLARILYLLLSMPPMAGVGVALLTASDVTYAPYLEGARRYGASALADQHTGGMIMWAGGTLALVATTLAIGWAAIRREEERAVARERYAPEGGGA